ncbi:MAG: TRAP transporter small permease [Gammaproteobacteria bacterium]|jgi:C4-dicarboxylate transporter, DctQ subunit|nr:TRAP transporter small permease [Gammaproteobacteria bacterium]
MSDKPQSPFEQLLFTMFCTGACILALITLFILYDVIARNAGIPTFTHTLTLTEYGLYYTTMLGAPWLVRKKHHIYMQLITAMVPLKVRPFVSKLSYLLCTLTCALICYYSGVVTLETFLRGDHEVRSFDMPRWLVFAVMPVSFFLLTVEFGRFLVGIDDMYDGEIGIHE